MMRTILNKIIIFLESKEGTNQLRGVLLVIIKNKSSYTKGKDMLKMTMISMHSVIRAFKGS